MNPTLVFCVANLAHQIDGSLVSNIVATGFKIAIFTVTNQHEVQFTAFWDRLILLVLLLAMSLTAVFHFKRMPS
jgi:ABC-type polysaccharide/polyol phosphate export permease